MTKEERKEYMKEYYQKNKDKLNKYQKEYDKKHRKSKKEYDKKYREKNKGDKKEYQKKYTLKRSYGISTDQYNDMMNKQNGKCSICNEPLKKPNIDHEHQTGYVRDILCHNCNTGIGYFKENPELLQKGIEYLEKHKNILNELLWMGFNNQQN
jgi:hypothetical protein